VQIISGLCEPDGSATTLLDLLQHLIDRRLLGQAPQLTSQVLLERLPAAFSATLKRRVHVTGKVANEHIH
jgi:hypothetical protein